MQNLLRIDYENILLKTSANLWGDYHGLEILQEIVAADASLQIWFDRNLDFGHGSLIDASLGNLPRLVTSRSIEKLSDDSRLVKKIDVKIGVVERAIYSIGRDTEVSSNGDRLMLEKFLNTDE